jgi:hypothetical protein
MQIIVPTFEKRKVILHTMVDVENQGMSLRNIEHLFLFFHPLRENILKGNKYSFNLMNEIPLEMFTMLPNLHYLNHKKYILLG